MVIPLERLDAALWIFHLSVVSAVVVILQAPFSAIIMAHERMNYYAFVGIIDVILKLFLAFGLAYSPIDKLICYGLVLFLITIIVFSLYFFYCKRCFDTIRIEKRIEKGLLKNMLGFSGWGLFGTFACVMREQGLNLVLNLFFGPVVNAARGIAYQVSSALQGFVTSISIASKPQMVSSYANGNYERTISLMYSMSKLSYFVLLLMSVPLCIDIDFILHIWLGDVVPDHTSAFVILVILTNFINNLNAPLSNVVYATGNMKRYEVVFSSINLMIIPLSIATLSTGMPPESAFLIYFIMTILVQVGCLWALNKMIEIRWKIYILKLIVPLILCTCLSLPIPLLIGNVMQSGWIRLFSITLVSSIISTTMFFLIVLNSVERKAIVGLIMKKIYKR